MATPLPTLCEITYDQGDVYGQSELPFIPYRHRSLSAKLDSPIHFERVPHREVDTASGFYNESYLIGCRTPHSYGTSLRSPTTGLSTYTAHPTSATPSRPFTLPPGYTTNTTSPYLDRDSPTQNARHGRSRARTAPCSSMPDLPHRRGTAFSMQSQISSKTDSRDEDKVQWVDALNRWVAENKTNNQMPYMTFVNSMSLEGRPAGEDDWITEELRLPCPNLHCTRFLAHMNEHHHSLNAHKQEIILRRRRIRAEKEAELRNKRDKSIQVQLEPSRSPSKVRFESPRAPTVKLPTPSADTEGKSPEPVPSSVTPWSEHSQALSTYEKRSSSGSPTPIMSDEFRKLSPESDAARSPSPKEPSPVPDVIIASPEPEKEDSEPERETTPEPTSMVELEIPGISPEAIVAEKSEEELEEFEENVRQSPLESSVASALLDAVSPIDKCLPKLEPQQCITAVSEPDIQLPSSISPPSTPFKTPDGSSLASPTTKVYSLKSPNAKPKTSKKTAEKTNKKEKKRSTPLKVVVQDTKSLELDVTSADPVDLETEPTPRPGSSPGRERHRRTHEKRERWKRTGEKKMIQIENLLPPKPKQPSKKSDEWIYGDDDFSVPLLPIEDDAKSVSSSVLPLPSPSLPESISLPPTPEPKRKLQMSNKIQIQLRKEEKRRWGTKKIDKSLAAERRREALEEERKKRLQEINQKIHSKKKDDMDDVDLSQGPSFDEYGLAGVHFEDYGWLAKYCIFNKSSLEIYKKTFDAVDDQAVGWLNAEDTMIAMRAVNRTLSSNEEQYIKRILEIVGYKVDVGADFKLFAVIAALSQKIAALDDWMKNIIGQLDYKMLDMKMFRCRMLWECNVDPEINKIPLDQLCVELRAGGVAHENIAEVRKKLGHLEALDLLDFMAYIPLFIMIHESVVDNPLDDTQDK